MKKFLLNGKRVEIIALILLLLLSAYLRLYKIRDYMTFLGDEGRDVMVVRKMIVTLHPVFLGPTASVGGFFLGPLYYYFMIPFLLLFRFDPVGPSVMVALFGVATVGLVYVVGTRFFGKLTGFVAATLYCLSPLVIAYSRSSWNPNLVPFFALLLIYSLYQAVHTRKWWWFCLVGLSFGCGLQFHYLFTFLVPVALVYFLAHWKDTWVKKPSTYFYLLGGWLLVTFPFLAFEIKNNFPNMHSIIQFVTAGREVAGTGMTVVSSVPDIIFRLFARLIFFFPPSEQWHLYDERVYILTMWRWGVSICFITAIVLWIYKWWKERTDHIFLLLCWFVFGAGLFFFYHRAVYDYYLGIMFPLPFLIIGNLITTLMRGKITRWLAIAGLVGLVWFNWSGRPFIHTPNKQLEQSQRIAQFVFDKAEGKPFNFALITGGNSDHAYRYFFELWGNTPITVENTVNDPERKTVTDQLLIVCEIGGCKPLGHSLWEIAGFGRAEIAGEWQVGVLQVFKLVHFNGQMVQ